MFGYEPEFVDCGDARIAFYDIGRGKPLVLLHGNGEDSSYWKAQIPEFTRFYRVIAVDSRGHGASDNGAQGLSFALMAEDLKKVLDACGVKKTHILGFSDGGNLAIKFALTYPGYVDKLILNGANVEMFGGIKPHFQLPIYAAYGLLAAAAHVSKKAARRRDVFGLMVRRYGVTLDDLAKRSSLSVSAIWCARARPGRWRRVSRIAGSRYSVTATISSRQSSRPALTGRSLNFYWGDNQTCSF